MAMGPVECRHGHNKAATDSCTSWVALNAKYCNREALSHEAEHSHMVMGPTRKVLLDESVNIGIPTKQFRVLPAIMLFH